MPPTDKMNCQSRAHNAVGSVIKNVSSQQKVTPQQSRNVSADVRRLDAEARKALMEMKSQLGELTRAEAGNQQYAVAKFASFVKPQTQSVIPPDSGRPGDEVRHAGSSVEKRSSPQDSTWPYFGPSTTARKPLIPRAKLRPATQPESKSDINQKKVVRFDPKIPPEPVSGRHIGKLTLPRVRLSSDQF